MEEINSTPPPKIKRKIEKPAFPWAMVLTLLITFTLGLGSGWLIWGRSAAGTAPAPQVQVGGETKRYDVPLDDDPVLGPENAPVTIVEFSDYQCPFCVSWNKEVFNRLMTEYEGKVRFVYRDFPLKDIHPDAVPAAEAADCAGEQGAYWQYHNALFGRKYDLGTEAYVSYATDLGLNLDQFKQCVSERRFQNEVEADFQFAAKFGVSSTPTFFINGLAVVGAQPYEVFKQIIDKELAGEIPK